MQNAKLSVTVRNITGSIPSDFGQVFKNKFKGTLFHIFVSVDNKTSEPSLEIQFSVIPHITVQKKIVNFLQKQFPNAQVHLTSITPEKTK